jgi:hypothetical protein
VQAYSTLSIPSAKPGRSILEKFSWIQTKTLLSTDVFKTLENGSPIHRAVAFFPRSSRGSLMAIRINASAVSKG